MNAAHLHLLVNHLPVIGTMICMLLLVVALILSRRRALPGWLVKGGLVASLVVAARIQP